MSSNSYFSPSVKNEILEYFWDDLQKNSRSIGDINPANPTQVWDKMSNGVHAWRKNNHNSLSDDNFVKNAWPNLLRRYPSKTHPTLNKLRDHIMNDPDRHFIPTQKDINAPQHFLRARHLISLLSMDPSVNITTDNDRVTFKAHRHPPAGKIFTSHWEYSPNGVKYGQTEGHENFKSLDTADKAPEVNKEPATKISQGVMVRRAGTNKSEDNPEGSDLPIVRGGSRKHNRESTEDAALHAISKREGDNLQSPRLPLDSMEPTSVNKKTGSQSFQKDEDEGIPDGTLWSLLKTEPLEKASKNVRLQRKKVFGTKANPPLKGDMREKHIDHIKGFVDKFLGLELHPSGGKIDPTTKQRRDADAEIGVDKPDWRSGRLESQWNPEAIVHEIAHLMLLPNGIGLEEGQRLMDKQYADVQKEYGYLQQKRSQHEVQPMAAENVIRRMMGLPATTVSTPVKSKDDPPRVSVEDPTQVIATRIQSGTTKEGEPRYIDLIRQSRNLSPQNKNRLENIFSGKIKFHPDHGWIPTNTIDSKISTREPNYFQDQSIARQASNVTPMANRMARMNARRGVGSTSKHTPYKTLEQIKQDNYIGAGGKEYDPKDLNNELQQRKQAAANKISAQPIPETDANRTNYTPDFMEYIVHSNKKLKTAKSEDLNKSPLSYDESDLADSWSENPTFEKRKQLHIAMMHPNHKDDRSKMIKSLSKDAKFKKIDNHWHFLLYRGVGAGEHPEDYKQDPRSYTYNPKIAKKFADEYGGMIIKQWIPLQHISYSFNHAHEIGGNKPYHGDESEVLVGPLHDYKKSLKKTERYEELKKFKKNSVCSMFMFEGVDHPDVLHVTHKYFSDSLDTEGKEELIRILKSYFDKNPFKTINTIFDKVEYFGEDKNIKVLRPQDADLFLPDLKQKLEVLKKDKYPDYKPHATVNDNLNRLEIPIIDYIVVDSGDVIFRASDYKKSDINKNEKLSKEELIHFSNTPNLQSIDPNRMGSSMIAGHQYKRAIPENRSSFYYTANSVPEEQVVRNSKHKYTVTLPPDHKIYDFDQDPQNLAHEARVRNNGAWNEDLFHGLVKEKGYHGVRWQMSPQTTVVQHYHPLTPNNSELIYKSELKKAYNPIMGNKIRGIADQYASTVGLKLYHAAGASKVNTDRAGKIAEAYHNMPHEPNSPAVKTSYNALINETNHQFDHLKNSGIKFSKIRPGMENPYMGGSKDVFKDLHENNHLWYFPTESGYGSEGSNVGDHPMLQLTNHVDEEGKQMPANDVFRIVHDVFGHAKEGFGFGPHGEESAWKHHMQMYSPEAQKALTSETRGQNSWVNFGPHGEYNRANPMKTIYADQKAGLMPDWTMDQSDHSFTKSEESMMKLKLKLETPKEHEHIDIPELAVLQWSVPIHRWDGE